MSSELGILLDVVRETGGEKEKHFYLVYYCLLVSTDLPPQDSGYGRELASLFLPCIFPVVYNVMLS